MPANDLSPASITRNLDTSFIGQRIIYYPRLASTMDTARQEAQRGAARGTVIIAGEQTEGRGRVKRPWFSPEGNVALSVILYPEISFLPYLIMLASLAVVGAIQAVTGLEPQIKWPNDILISGKKVSGILIESDVTGDRVAYAIIGIGINIELKLPEASEILATATSLNHESGRQVSRQDLVRHLLVELERLYLTLPEGEYIFESWRDRLVTIGRRVSVVSGKNSLEGIAESVDRNGALLLRCTDGSYTKIVAGDVNLRDK